MKENDAMQLVKHFVRFFCLLLFANTSWAMPLDTDSEQVAWQGAPIVVELAVDEERRVEFRAPVSVGVPESLQARLRTQTVNGTVYWLAHEPFATTRVLVRELDAGQTYLLDVKASTAAVGSDAIRVAFPPDSVRQTGASGVWSDSPGYVTLTRFAAQQLFAPLRLASSLAGVARVPVPTAEVDLLPGDAVESIPLMAWRAGGLYLTAVKLTNRTNRPQVLDPRHLTGNWLAATFQHARLLPAGDRADSTALYLISAQPYAAAL